MAICRQDDLRFSLSGRGFANGEIPMSARTVAKHLIGCVTSLALLTSTVDASPAAGAMDSLRQSGAAQVYGFISMVRLQIPFGGGERTYEHPRLALGVGPSWRVESDLPAVGSYSYRPSLEAGVTFDGSAILRFGSIDMLRSGQ